MRDTEEDISLFGFLTRGLWFGDIASDEVQKGDKDDTTYTDSSVHSGKSSRSEPDESRESKDESSQLAKDEEDLQLREEDEGAPLEKEEYENNDDISGNPGTIHENVIDVVQKENNDGADGHYVVEEKRDDIISEAVTKEPMPDDGKQQEEDNSLRSYELKEGEDLTEDIKEESKKGAELLGFQGCCHADEMLKVDVMLETLEKGKEMVKEELEKMKETAIEHTAGTEGKQEGEEVEKCLAPKGEDVGINPLSNEEKVVGNLTEDIKEESDEKAELPDSQGFCDADEILDVDVDGMLETLQKGKEIMKEELEKMKEIAREHMAGIEGEQEGEEVEKCPAPQKENEDKSESSTKEVNETIEDEERTLLLEMSKIYSNMKKEVREARGYGETVEKSSASRQEKGEADGTEQVTEEEDKTEQVTEEDKTEQVTEEEDKTEQVTEEEDKTEQVTKEEDKTEQVTKEGDGDNNVYKENTEIKKLLLTKVQGVETGKKGKKNRRGSFSGILDSYQRRRKERKNKKKAAKAQKEAEEKGEEPNDCQTEEEEEEKKNVTEDVTEEESNNSPSGNTDIADSSTQTRDIPNDEAAEKDDASIPKTDGSSTGSNSAKSQAITDVPNHEDVGKDHAPDAGTDSVSTASPCPEEMVDENGTVYECDSKEEETGPASSSSFCFCW